MELFNYFSNYHNLTLTETEMNDIIAAVNKHQGLERIRFEEVQKIEAELSTAEKKYPNWPASLPTGVSVITEELGDLAQAVNDYDGLMRTPEDQRRPDHDLTLEKVRELMEKEAVDVIATALRFMKNLPR